VWQITKTPFFYLLIDHDHAYATIVLWHISMHLSHVAEDTVLRLHPSSVYAAVPKAVDADGDRCAGSGFWLM
jgi:hypothetical protein